MTSEQNNNVSGFQQCFIDWEKNVYMKKYKNDYIGKYLRSEWEAKFDPTEDIQKLFKRKHWNSPYQIVNVNKFGKGKPMLKKFIPNKKEKVLFEYLSRKTSCKIPSCLLQKSALPLDPSTEETPDNQKDKRLRVLGFKIRNIKCSVENQCKLCLINIAEKLQNARIIELGIVDGRNYLKYEMSSSNIKVTLFENGWLECSGSQNKSLAIRTAREVVKSIKALGYKFAFKNFKILEVHSTVYFPWDIDVLKFANDNKNSVTLKTSPELEAKCSLDNNIEISVFDTGAVNMITTSNEEVQNAINSMYVLLYEYRILRNPTDNNLVESLISYGNNKGGFNLNFIKYATS